MLVTDIDIVEHMPTWVDLVDLEVLVPELFDGAPTVVTWWDVVRAASMVGP